MHQTIIKSHFPLRGSLRPHTLSSDGRPARLRVAEGVFSGIGYVAVPGGAGATGVSRARTARHLQAGYGRIN
ncbi:hypothetical protein EVAR_30365_1 [Eumeta japonica]|uniref:Uncharacterized protein n=1 Tax=Eumeta variegata TaxID=151549 RepID=A0A4C1W7Y4_EUMVA|nr:hypothetical protein EVAR_30365_1 [Eumeta japonica]